MRSTTQIFQTSAKLLLLFIPIILSWSLACGPTESTCTRDSDCNRTQHCSSANRCVTNDEHTDDEKTSGEEQSTQTDGGNHDGPCQPKTCEDQGKNCGQVDDTCGKIIVCGDCPSGETSQHLHEAARDKDTEGDGTTEIKERVIDIKRRQKDRDS